MDELSVRAELQLQQAIMCQLQRVTGSQQCSSRYPHGEVWLQIVLQQAVV